MNKLVAGEGGASFYEIENVEKQFICEDLVTGTCYTAGWYLDTPPQAQRLSGKEIDKATLVGRYCSCFCYSLIAGSWIPRRKRRQFT